MTTHDSIGLGEDGPTHQPIEHLASLRAMPNILMIRPGDGNETAGAYKVRFLTPPLSGYTTFAKPFAVPAITKRCVWFSLRHKLYDSSILTTTV